MAADLSRLLEALNTNSSGHGSGDGSGLNPTAADFNKALLVRSHSLVCQTQQKIRSSCFSSFGFSTAAPSAEALHPSPPLDRLAPITLLEMKVDVTHHGRVLFGTLCVDAFLVVSVATCLEVDGGAMAVRVYIYNALPSTSSASQVQKLFPKGTHVAIKEPYLKRSLDGMIGIRINNPNNMEWLNHPSPHSKLDHDELRKQGNQHFQKQEWESAIDCYTHCIQLTSEKCSSTASSILLAYSNRSEAWMKLRSFEKSLQDSNRALEIDPGHVKSLFRKGRALHGLRQYKQACTSFQEALQKDPQSREIQDALQHSRQCCTQIEEGDFSHVTDYLIASAVERNVVAPHCTDFVGPVDVRMTPDGRGRGLFACQDVKVGEILLVSNPLALCHQYEKSFNITIDPASKSMYSASQEDLVTTLIALATSSRKALHQLYSLQSHSNPSNPLKIPPMQMLETGTDGNLAWLNSTEEDVDIPRIRGIVRFNSFGGQAPWILEKRKRMMLNVSQGGFTGLWLLPSFINHSCLPNAVRSGIGEAMFIHAASNIPENQEITISYFDNLLPLSLREEKCKNWGFSCKCKRCLVERSVKEPLKSISGQFSALHDKAVEEAISALKAGEVFPAELPECTVFGRLTLKLEKVIETLRNLTPLEKNWIRASYATAYLAGMQAINFLEESLECLSGEEIVEAMRDASPGNIHTLLATAFQARYVKSVGASSTFIGNRLTEQAMDECIRTFGKWKPQVLEALIAIYGGIPPFP